MMVLFHNKVEKDMMGKNIIYGPVYRKVCCLMLNVSTGFEKISLNSGFKLWLRSQYCVIR